MSCLQWHTPFRAHFTFECKQSGEAEQNGMCLNLFSLTLLENVSVTEENGVLSLGVAISDEIFSVKIDW